MPETDTASGPAGSGAPVAGRADRLVLLGAVFCLALVLRLVLLAQISGTPFGQELFLDSLVYSGAAERVLAGEPPGATAYFVDPLYTYFLALLYLLTGHSILAVRVVQAVLGAATAALTAWLGEEISGDRRVGLLAGLGVATYGLMIFHDLQVLKTPLEVLLGLASVVLLVAARRRGSLPLHLAAGAVLGAGILTHGSYLLLPPALAAWMLLDRRRPGAPREWAAVAALAAGVLLPLAPVAARNAAVSGQLVLTTYNAGMNFWEGNNPESDGAYRRPSFLRGDPLLEEEDSRLEAERRAGRTLGPAEISSFWFRESLRWIASHPRDGLLLLGRKLLLFWNYYEVDDNLSFYFVRQFIPFLAWPLPGFRVWGALGLAGMLLGWRQARRWAPAYLFVACQVAAVVAFHVIDRYRLPVVPFLAMFGAAIAVAGWDAAASRRWRRLALIGVSVAAAAALVNGPRFYRPEETFSRPYYALGKYYFERGEPRPAEEFCRRSLAVDPAYAPPHAVLAKILLASGRPEEALPHFRESMRLDPSYPDSFYGEGIALLRLGRLEEAEGRFRSLHEADPGGPATVWLGEVALAGGRAADAAAWFRSALPGSEATRRPALLGLARALRDLGDLPGARGALESLPATERDAALAQELGMPGPGDLP